MNQAVIAIMSLLFFAAAVVMVVAAMRLRRTAKGERRTLDIEKQRLLERLGAGLAHELKNPLGALNLNLELVEEELKESLPSPSAQRLRLIRAECRRLQDVIDNFLRYTRDEPLELERVCLNALVEEVTTFLTPQLARSGIAVEKDLDETVPECLIDTALFKHALLNVALNAIDAMQQGGTLTLTTSATSASVSVVFTDTGAGIEPENLPHVFEAYFSCKRGGTGLGLAITKRIIEKHGGEITIESAAGRGSKVTMTLPVNRQNPGSEY